LVFAAYKTRWGNNRVKIKHEMCVYCGMMADTEDHFPPRSYGISGLLLPACRECNSFASDSYPTNFEKRVAYVKKKIAVRYKKHLKTAVFDEEELNSLNGNLKRSVVLWQQQRRIIVSRIAFPAIMFLDLIDKNNDFARLFVGLSGITEND